MINFIKEMLSNQDNISSKRVMAIVLIISYIGILYLSLWFTISEFTYILAKTGLYSALLLFGGTIIEKFKDV